MTKTELSQTAGIFTLCKSILGASLVLLPSVFAELGIVLGGGLVLAMMMVNAKSLMFIMLVSKQILADDLSEIGEHVAKKKGKMIVMLLLFFACIIPLIFYIKLTTGYYYDLLSIGNFGFSKTIVRILVAVAAALLCIVFRDVSKLKFVSIAGLACLVLLTIYILYVFIGQIKYIDYKSLKYVNLTMKSLEKFSVICFAYCSQFGILSITNNIQSPKQCKKVIWISNFISAVIYLITGICGYMVTHPKECDDLLKSLPKGFCINFLYFSLGTVNLCTFPLILLPTRQAFHYFISLIKETKSSFLVDTIETISIVVLCFLMALIAEMDDMFLNVMFFFAGSLVMFAMPSYFYVKVFRKNIKFQDWIAIFISGLLTVFGLGMSVKGIVEMFKKIKK